MKPSIRQHWCLGGVRTKTNLNNHQWIGFGNVTDVKFGVWDEYSGKLHNPILPSYLHLCWLPALPYLCRRLGPPWSPEFSVQWRPIAWCAFKRRRVPGQDLNIRYHWWVDEFSAYAISTQHDTTGCQWSSVITVQCSHSTQGWPRRDEANQRCHQRKAPGLAMLNWNAWTWIGNGIFFWSDIFIHFCFLFCLVGGHWYVDRRRQEKSNRR